MTKVWAVFFMSGFICASSQYIYLNERKDCNRNEENKQTISTLLDEMRKIQHEVDELRKETVKLQDLVTNLTTSSLQQEVDELRRSHGEIKELLTNLTSTRSKLNSDCKDLYVSGQAQSGIYEIHPFGNNSQVSVYCDMVTEGGGWTTIQKRVSGSVRFNRTWAEYKTGFGSTNDSYWIGNDVIHKLTKERNSSLYVSFTLTNGTKLYELYNQFSVADETYKYTLFLGGPATGTLGDAMLDALYSWGDLSGMSFTTLDRDHDRSDGNCANNHGGGSGWWYNACHLAYLNGPWSPANWENPWWPTVTNSEEIKETLMMIKPH